MSARCVVVIGPAGSGKSTIAQRLAGVLGAAYLDKDAMLSEFVAALLVRSGRRPHDRESDSLYRDEIMPLEYRALWRVAAENARIGTPVVIDAPFVAYLDDPAYLERELVEVGGADIDVDVLHVMTREDVMHERLVARGNARDEWKLANWAEFWAAQGGRRCRWTGARHLVIDNSGPPPAEAALRLLILPES